MERRGAGRKESTITADSSGLKSRSSRPVAPAARGKKTAYGRLHSPGLFISPTLMRGESHSEPTSGLKTGERTCGVRTGQESSVAFLSVK